MGRIRGVSNINWSLTFRIALDTIWNTRNDFVLNNNRDPVQMLVRRTLNKVCLVIAAHQREQRLCGRTLDDLSTNNLIWYRPPISFLTLNCDASVKNGGNYVSCGGILRD